MLSQERRAGVRVHQGVPQFVCAGKQLLLLGQILIDVDYFETMGFRVVAADGAERLKQHDDIKSLAEPEGVAGTVLCGKAVCGFFTCHSFTTLSVFFRSELCFCQLFGNA